MIGDVLTSTILFELLKRQYPSSELHYLVNSHTLAVIENNPFIDKVLLFTPEMEAKKSEIRSLIQEVREQHYDTVIDVYSKLSSNLITFLSGAKTKVSVNKSYTSFIYDYKYLYSRLMFV